MEDVYRVSWTKKAEDETAEQAGQLQTSSAIEELIAVLQAIGTRLRTNPLGFGEPYRSRGSVHEHLALLGGVAIDFAVDSIKRFVLVRHCRLLSREDR